MKQIAILGSTGFIGKTLLDLLSTTKINLKLSFLQQIKIIENYINNQKNLK